jgi:hypothetical protein
MLVPFPKMFDRAMVPSVWKTVISTKELLKTTKDTAQESVSSHRVLSTKENGETIIHRETVFFTPDKTKLLKVDLTKEWFQTVNQSK